MRQAALKSKARSRSRHRSLSKPKPSSMAKAAAAAIPSKTTLTSTTVTLPEDWLLYPAFGSLNAVLVALPGLGGTAASFPSALFVPCQLSATAVLAVTYPPRVDDVSAIAASTWERLSSLGLGGADTRVVLLGYSFGGFVAQEMAMQAPAALAGLVLVATSCQPPARLVRDIVQRIVSADSALDVPFAAAALSRAPAAHVHATLTMNQTCERLGSLQGRFPVLILHGDNDAIVDVSGAVALAQILRSPQTVLRVLPGMSHAIISKRTEATAKDVAAFCAGTSM